LSNLSPSISRVSGGAVRASAAKAKAAREPWGALELIALSRTVIPALQYIPGANVVRTPLRVVDYSLVLLVWAWVLVHGRRQVGRTFVPKLLLAVCAGWLLISIAHPTTNSLISGTAQAFLVISIMSPVFWVPQLKITPERMSRLLRLIFFANLLSSMWGLGQVYMPDRFNPPDIAIFHRSVGMEGALSLTTSSGRRIIRPCGLTDTPGAAAGASANVIIIGLLWSLRPMPLWRRAALVGVCFFATGIIYISQVRVMLLTMVASLIATTVVFVLRGSFGKATVLAVILGTLVAGGLGWAAYVGGEAATKRFAALFEEDALTTYQQHRGGFLQKAIYEELPRFPLGAGLGRWGQIYYYFGNKAFPFGVGRGELYSEIQISAWVYDGGLPLLAMYASAALLAVWSAFRLALHANDPALSNAACPIFAMGLTLLAVCLGAMPFIGPAGVQFWLLTTALFVSNEQTGVAARRARLAAARGGAR